jgi:protein-tyrosine kinase
MSKIESALAKARGRGQLQSVKTTAPGTGIVAVEQRSAPHGEADRVAASKALTRMQEPRLLDAAALAERRIIHIGMADVEAVTAFRELRTKILQTAQKNCTIMVTSCADTGSSSSIATNLAIAFSLDDSKTAMLLDCNLGAPKLDHLVSSRDARGITDYLKGDGVGLEQVIHSVGVKRLRVIPAGRGHDHMAEYFTSNKMRELLNELRGRYIDRYIVLDAPPIVESADARVLVELADFAVLVVPYGSATEAQIAAAAKIIGEKKLLGVVFSDVPRLPKERLGLPWWLRILAHLWRGFVYKNPRKN